MGFARVASRAQLGLVAPRVDVEVHLGGGLPVFSVVGLAATAVKESKDRVRAALLQAGFEFPAGRITVNLSPADLPKEGCRYDLPMALGILLASSQLRDSQRLLAQSEFYGELGLAGELKPVRGILQAAAHAARDGRHVIVPAANLTEARFAAPARASGADSLLAVCAMFRARGKSPVDSAEVPPLTAPSRIDVPKLEDVRGQATPKRALLIAAAGGHSLLFIGPPGTGKTMLAQRLPGLLPPLEEADALEVASIASVSARGFDARDYGRRPFRAPHHSASTAAIIGGGPRAQPGEVSLAHRGVLFLDELPEFNRAVLESLREPLESGTVSIARASLRLEYPARFQLVAAMNPCPCGFFGDPSGRCRCSLPEIARYRARVSGPLLDRVDMRVEVAAVPNDDLLNTQPVAQSTGESERVAARVLAAQRRQLRRAGKLNAEIAGSAIEQMCRLDRRCRALVAQARDKLQLSARGLHRALRVARTIADLEAADHECADAGNDTGPKDSSVSPAHLAEALQLRRAIE